MNIFWWTLHHSLATNKSEIQNVNTDDDDAVYKVVGIQNLLDSVSPSNVCLSETKLNDPLSSMEILDTDQSID